MPEPSDRPPIPELAGATSDPISLGTGVTRTAFEIRTPVGAAILGANRKLRQAVLGIENITSEIDAPSYDVYLYLPENAVPAAHTDLYAGCLPLFGIAESSANTEKHGGGGLTYRLDITRLYFQLAAARKWNNSELQVAFVSSPWIDAPVNVKVGRVSLYFI